MRPKTIKVTPEAPDVCLECRKHNKGKMYQRADGWNCTRCLVELGPYEYPDLT